MPAKDSNTTDSDNARLNMIRNAVHGVKRDNADTSTTNESKTQKVKKNTSKAEPDLYLESDDNPERASCDISAGTLFEKFLKRRQYVESGRWSVAELKISFPELQELVGWLQSAEQYEINETHDRGWSKALDPSSRYTNKVVVGLLLHIIYAESVRRYGTEGSYWSCVYNQLPWKESNRRHLFIHNGQPSSFHREILENSAQALKMRHTFGIDGVQQWFSTGFLQFGFTYGGFKRRLGEWLAGYHTSTNAIEALTHDRELRSDSFASLWGNLSRYRLGQLTDAQLENRIKDSCWILNEWVSDLKLAAKQKLHLGTQLGRREGSDTDPEFLSNPALAFSNTGQPEFNFRLTGLIELPLTADRYTLTIDEQPKLDLIRQNDGGYDPIGDEDFTVPWTKYQIQAAVKDSRTGTQIASQTLNMWQPDEFLHVFTENGRKYQDAFALKGNPGNSVHIMFPTLLSHEIEGNENSTWTSPDDTWTIISISPDVNVRLLLEGELFWELKDALKPSNELIQGREFINNALSVEVSPVDVQSGLLLTTIKVAAHESISIRWARIGFEALDFEEGTKRAVLPILPEYLERGVSIQFAVEAFGQKVLIRKRIQIPYSGAFWISSDGVKYEVPRVLHTQDVSKIKLCAFPRGASPDDDTSGYCITEGNHFSRRLAKNAIQLSGLSGLGSPLFLNKGLFNQFDTPQVLADAVIDGGCIHQVKISEDCLTVFPSIFTGLKDNFIPIVWVGTEGNMRLEKLKLEEGTVSETEHQVWRAQNSFSNEQINAIGIFYEGECIGSWWNLSSWTMALRDCPTNEQAEEYAKVIRIFNCPILYEETRSYLTDFMQKYPAEALLPWLIPNLKLTFENDYKLGTTPNNYNTWLRAVGILFEEAMPTMDLATVSLLIEDLTTSKDTLSLDSLAKVVHVLTAASPALAAQVISPWLKDFATYSNARKANEFRKELMHTLEPSEEELEDIAVNLIRANSHFIREHCSGFGKDGFHLPPVRSDNLPYLFEYSITRRMAVAQHLRHHKVS